MASLIEQINDLLTILDVVNPAAAKEIRGSSPIVERMEIPEESLPVLDSPPRNLDTNPLTPPITADNLVQGIVLAEILGKPVSKRPRRNYPGL